MGRDLAERAGFEPAVPVKVHTLSRRAYSTTLAPFRCYLAVNPCGEREIRTPGEP